MPAGLPSPGAFGETMQPTAAGRYPWHRDIVATSFWVGEIHDPAAPDGSQVRSAYDSFWLDSYGGCDGEMISGSCETEVRPKAADWMPSSMTPLENPFYIDLPLDDANVRGFLIRPRQNQGSSCAPDPLLSRGCVPVHCPCSSRLGLTARPKLSPVAPSAPGEWAIRRA